MTTVLTDTDEFAVETTDGLRLPPDEIARVTGWEHKPEGMCRGPVCVPLSGAMSAGGRIDLAAFWRHLGNPVLASEDGDVWVLGTGAEERNAALVGLQGAGHHLAGPSRRATHALGVARQQGLPHHLGVLVRLSI